MGADKRIFVALFGAPAIVTALAAILFASVFSALPGFGFRGALEASAMLYLLTQLSVAIIGLPVHSFLLRQNCRDALCYFIAGSASGALCGLILGVLASLQNVSYMTVSAPLFSCSIGGMISALLFWLIRRPDRDAPPQNKEATDHAV